MGYVGYFWLDLVFSILFHRNGNKALAQFTQGGCAISVLGEGHKPTWQLALGVPT